LFLSKKIAFARFSKQRQFFHFLWLVMCWLCAMAMCGTLQGIKNGSGVWGATPIQTLTAIFLFCSIKKGLARLL
jgi:hypothetical protein